MVDKEPNPRKKFDRIIHQEGVTPAEFLIGEAVEFAMKIREHPAAHRTGYGHGMVSFYRASPYSWLHTLGVAAVVVTGDGGIVVEHHYACGEHPESRTYSSCRLYDLPIDPTKSLMELELPHVGEGEDRIEGCKYKNEINDWGRALDFNDTIRRVIGEGEFPGTDETISGGKQIVNELEHLYGHQIAHPFIQELIDVAFDEV